MQAAALQAQSLQAGAGQGEKAAQDATEEAHTTSASEVAAANARCQEAAVQLERSM